MFFYINIHFLTIFSRCEAMPAALAKDVSIPFYFICVLHLANEHNLNLVPDVDPFSSSKDSLGNFAIVGNNL